MKMMKVNINSILNQFIILLNYEENTGWHHMKKFYEQKE
jgi:hypothetical protein